MKKFVYSAVALTMATGASYAAETGWASLDQEISGLSSSLTAQNAGGPKVGGWVITSVRSQKDGATKEVAVDTDGDGIDDDTETQVTDELGFGLDQVRLHVTGDVSNDYSYKVSFELENGTADLKDAYIKWKLMDSISATMGQFYVPTSRSATRDETTLLFMGRTTIGALLNDGYGSELATTILDAAGGDVAGRDQGIMVSGSFEMVSFGVAIQNGLDENADELRITLNATADVMGKGAGAVEGAYGSAEGTNLSVGGYYHMDDGAFLGEGNDVFGAEAYFTMGSLAVSGEFADFDALDSSLWNITGSYLFTEMYEASVRYEDNDDAGDQISVGVNRYSAGHNLKWTVQYVTVDLGDLEDLGAKVEDEIAIGATLAF